jgi:hypothetical protein
MKVKKIQLFVLAYFIIVLVKFAVERLNPVKYISLKPVFEGMLIGIAIVCVLYYAGIYIIAWVRNRKEEINRRSNAE